MRIEVTESRAPDFEGWVERWYPGWCAAWEEGLSAGLEDPVFLSPAERLASLRAPRSTSRRFLLVAVDERCAVAGAARAELPLTDNVELCSVEVVVPPERRRRGHGTALLHAARDLAAAHGRTSLLGETDRPPTVPVEQWPGPAFALRHGFTMRLQSIRRDLHLPLDPARVARLRSEAVPLATGYRLECLSGRVRPEDRGRMAALKARMTTDAPMGDLAYEPEVWDAARVLEQEEEVEAMGLRWWTAVAVAPDGEWVGFTQLGWSADDAERLHQWDTLVVAGHRGHRLGLLLKLAALERATREAPRARRVSTWNAASNTPMVAVNEAMGYTVTHIGEEWQVPLSQLA